MGFVYIEVFGLNLCVFYKNSANYVAMFPGWAFSKFFRETYILYGKRNKIIAKKLAASARFSEA